MKNKSFPAVVIVLLTLAILLMGCGASKTVKGGAIGAGAGAIIGGLIGKAAGNTAAGAIIGAAIGGTAGALIGHKMDMQAEEIKKDIAGAKVERIGEGIKITFDSGILFKTNSSDLQPVAQENIRKLAGILNKYPDTNILVEGHTDSTGSAEYNQKLSERRSEAVANFAKGQGVDNSRFTSVGYGEAQPVASNSSSDGRQQNRRVEIAIFANDKMKDAATEGKLE
ncbi:MAG TPA: OmpA family protein [Bacteroidota bacterium]|jgi:outer membrane protein OmpA-like peptidoglycan-associated protein|nr:OmpA family protein [Bacteroidota bacterium]